MLGLAYQKSFCSTFQRIALWEPDYHGLGLGEIVRYSGPDFDRIGTLQGRGIRFEATEWSRAFPKLMANRKAYSLDAGGDAKVPVDAALKVGGSVHGKFKKSGDFLLVAADFQECEITSLDDLEKQLMPLWKEGRWNANWIIVTKVWRYQRFTCLISDASARSIDVSGRLNFIDDDTSAGGLLKLEQGSDAVAKYIGSPTTGYRNPMFLGKSFRRSLFGDRFLVRFTPGGFLHRFARSVRVALSSPPEDWSALPQENGPPGLVDVDFGTLVQMKIDNLDHGEGPTAHGGVPMPG